MKKPQYVSISGNIGSGKTSLVNSLNDKNIKCYFEPDENPFLEDFYNESKKWAFHSQVFYLTEFLEIHKSIEKEKSIVLQERSISESFEIFTTKMFKDKLLSQREMIVCSKLYDLYFNSIRKPDLIIYLSCSTEVLLERISNRARYGEHLISLDYLEKLNKEYDNWISSKPKDSYLVLDANDKIQNLKNKVLNILNI